MPLPRSRVAYQLGYRAAVKAVVEELQVAGPLTASAEVSIAQALNRERSSFDRDRNRLSEFFDEDTLEEIPTADLPWLGET